ncbi:hypothetical protein EEL32_00050 (plasmid) [Brevibacillus laterosporus]|nr:hypothetical protein [Brevibacillus laterosporus]TPG93487.1 hypothetical protein EEL32_00050 [Brevibacillus laterosporus]
MSTSKLSFTQGASKTPRNELDLPPLHFVAMDDWVDKLGDTAFISWLKFFTWCDRSDKSREHDAIPNSMNKLAKKLGVGKDTLYNKIIKPLWNYGLIDLEQVVKASNTYVNIIVYKYPQNTKALKTEPLKQIRDYEKDYNSKAREDGKKGGRPKNSKSKVVLDENHPGSEIEPPLVPDENHPGSEIEPNNKDLNLSNSYKSLSNLLNKYLSNLSMSEKVRAWIEKQILLERLTDGRKLKTICDIYFELIDTHEFTDQTFVEVCNRVLDTTAKTSFKGLLRKSIQNHMNLVTSQNVPQPKTIDEIAIPENLIELYTLTKPIIDKIKNTDLPKSEKWNQVVSKIQEETNLSWVEAKLLAMDLNQVTNDLP